VSHNAEAAQTLAENLGASGYARETIGVFGMLRDKDIAAVARAVAPRITRWHVASLPGPRGASAAEVLRALAAAGIAQPCTPHDSAASAFAAARSEAREDDKIVAFGSFLTVAEVMQALATRGGREPHG
jgi:dihydrofolate synthase/folylpolyglutamate synthase